MFLTGQEEIESIERLIQERLPKLPEGKRKLLVIPIFASLPSEKQMKVFMPPPSGFRKVALFPSFLFASNILDMSSLTGQLDALGYCNLKLLVCSWIIH